jgi:amino acid transporter
VAPQRHLHVGHAVSVCVGMVIGAGIFKTSPLVAANLSSDMALYLAWLAGGVLSLVGGLCFAEMAAAFPDPGGDYHFLRRAFGMRFGFLFAWSRFAIIHTGSMALLAFVFGDYLAQVLPGVSAAGAAGAPGALGEFASPLCAAAIVALLVALNLAGVRIDLSTQIGLMLLVLAGLALVAGAGAALAWQGVPPATPLAVAEAAGAADAARVNWGTAMMFVFLAYGGWSDAATLSAEMRDERHGIVAALVIGLGLIAVLYLSANWGYLRGLGLDGLAASTAPAADLARLAFGRGGELVMVAIVTTTSVSVMNASLIAGARTTYAAARDLELAGGPATPLARWHGVRGTPSAAVLAIGAVALLLVGLGTWTRGGFATMVDYLSPVYWGFLLASGLAIIVLRRRHPEVPRPFRVPLYPVLPLAFCGCSAYLLWASLVYVKVGALVGVAVLAAGAVTVRIALRPARRAGS